MKSIPRFIIDSVHIAALAALALAQPLFDLLSRTPEFFAVRHSSSIDIIFFALVVSLVPGAIYLLFALAANRLIPRGYRYLHLVAVGTLVFLILLPAMHQGLELSPWPSVGFSLGIAIAGVLIYQRHVVGRRFLHLLTPAILLLPALFLFYSPVNHLLTPPQLPHVESAELSGSTPVVVVIFDELPLSSLLTLDETIDAELFPGFSELAAQATCYPNAYSVAEYTTQAIPAIVTGRLPKQRNEGRALSRNMDEWLGTPTAYDYPRSLFTALGDHYEMRVVESVTRLCPKTLCPETGTSSSFSDRIAHLFRDLSVVYAHILLPKPWTVELPPVDLGWADFVIGHLQDLREDDVELFRTFIRSLVPSERPTLYLHHSTLPHSPWTYLPSGKRYGSVSNDIVAAQNRWSSEIDSRLAYQRHLLQTIFADSLLKQTLEKIKHQGFFDQALIIVTADHGASFRAGSGFRELESGNENDIINVPLCIKYPGQAEATVSYQSAASVDLLPTILRSLGSELPWPVDGSALQSKDVAAGHSVVVYDKQGKAKKTDLLSQDRDRSVANKVTSFGQGDTRGLVGHPLPELIDQHVSSMHRLNGTGGDAEIEGLDKITRPDAHRNWLPALVKGQVLGAACEDQCPDLVLAVNDYIAAILHPLKIGQRAGNFAAVVSDTHLHNGRNELSLYSVEKCDTGRCLRPMTLSAADG